MAALNLDEDFPMGESVMPSTELNGTGDHAAVDPSKILANTSDHLSPKLPFHGLHPRAGSTPRPFSSPRHRGSPKLDPDVMDISRASSVSTTVQVRVPPPPRFPPLWYSTRKTGLVYDTAMRFHAESPDLMMQDDYHPEDPRRISEIFNEIQQAGLVQGADNPDEEAHEDQCWRILARTATRAEICLIHTQEHYDFIESLQHMPAAELKRLSESHDSIYFNNSTFMSATLAAGGAIEACRAVVRRDVRNAIAIIRPPGHHAESDSPSGFCIFNNVPIAARVCQKDFPEMCRKVLILDWDVHHGNGVQHAFYNDPNVLYISLHVYKGGMFYPSLPDGNYDYTGEGSGIGRNVNIPWADVGMGDAEYLYAFQEVVMPIATEFNPDLVIISAGFDAADGDLLGGCHVTPACYSHMTHMLMQLAEGKVAVCLEGGYNLRAIAKSALAVTRTLMLQPPERLADTVNGPKQSAVHTVMQVKRAHSKYWKCLYPKRVDKTNPTFHATTRLHEIVRAWQSQMLSEEQRMVPVKVNKPGIAHTFEHNIIATPDFLGAHPLLVIFHDPPEIRVEPDPVTGKIELHNSWLTDDAKDYVAWAIENGFQVIDVNIPKVVTFEDDDGSYVHADDHETRIQQTRELAGYLWENYIEPHSATQVFFMGIGSAYLGLVDLLGAYEKCTDDTSVVQCLIGFLSSTTLQSIKRPTDDNIAAWYYDHSLIFIDHNHAVWDPLRVRKLRKKWGKLKRSDMTGLEDMLVHHKYEVQKYILALKSEAEERNREFQNDRKKEPQQFVDASRSRGPSAAPESKNHWQGSSPLAASSTGAVKNMPKLGYFSVGVRSPKIEPASPSSGPMKGGFRRD
ncbi:putative histone deacetylase [Byssothecium circinans]|uniref:histone deacetylase n=1 Tax=Byssothecium circinans TaxID=147558 RepID=A0A6A5UB38_9PLEO|nr:putative histone deacetylase [Byssothecium circinans]